MNSDKSLTDSVRDFFSQETDLKKFTEKNYKRDFIEKVTNETKANPKSVDALVNKILKEKAPEAGLSKEEFTRKKSKRFDNSLSMDTDRSKVKVDENPEEKKKLTVKNDKHKDAPENKMTNYPMDSFVGGIDSFFANLMDEYTTFTKQEKEDAGVALNMAVGGYLDDDRRLRAAMGFMTLFMIFGGKIGSAKKKQKAKKKIEEFGKNQKVQTEETKPTEITQNDKDALEEAKLNYKNQVIQG